MADWLREIRQRAAEENARLEVRVLNESFRQKGLLAQLASRLVGMKVHLTGTHHDEPRP